MSYLIRAARHTEAWNAEHAYRLDAEIKLAAVTKERDWLAEVNKAYSERAEVREKELAATKAKLEQAEKAIDAIMDMSKGTQTPELLAIWRICHAAVWTTPNDKDTHHE